MTLLVVALAIALALMAVFALFVSVVHQFEVRVLFLPGGRAGGRDALEVAGPRLRAARPPRVGNASRQVFSRIVDVCLDEQVSALLLAGDFMTASRSR